MLPPSASAHGPAVGPEGLAPAAPGSAEARLRALETETLGAEHAAAHALQRTLAAHARRAPAARVAPPPLAPVAPATGGAWAPAAPIPVIAIHAVLLPTGKVLIFAYPGRPGEAGSGYENRAEAYVGYPGDPPASWRRVDPPIDPATGHATDIWCGGASFLADGRVLVAGGNLDANPATVFTGQRTVFTFDPWTESWQTEPSMRQGRWYPTQVRLPDGRTLISSGLTAPGDPDFGNGPATESGGMNSDAEIFAPGTGTTQLDFRFNDPGRPPLSALYPRMFWTHTGHVLAAGPSPTDSWLLDAGPPSTWADVPDLARQRDWGTAVMLADGRVLTFGGSRLDQFSDADGDAFDDFSYRPATGTTEVFDPNTPAAGWMPATAMELPRSHANSVLLPDGTVATVGGGFGEDGSQRYYRWLYDDEQRRVELFDPRTGATVLGAAQAEARTYHSTALLLPDARVMSAGDDINGADGPGTGVTNDTAEVYSPPYLFNPDGSPADRPQLAAAPATAVLGADIDVVAAGVPASKAVLVAPGAVTHATDMNQRIVSLAAPTPLGGGGLRLHVPSDANVVLPGYYMLFLLSDAGVPSVARFIRITAPQPAPLSPSGPPPAPPPAAPPPRAAGKAKLTITGKLPGRRTLLRTRRFSVTVSLTRPGRVALSALLERPRGRTIAIAGRRTLRFTTGGRRNVTLTLTRRGRRLLAPRRRRAVVRIRAQATLVTGRRLPAVIARRALR